MVKKGIDKEIRCPICNSRQIYVRKSDGKLACYNCWYDERKESLGEAKKRIDLNRLVTPLGMPRILSKQGTKKTSGKSPAPKDGVVSCAVCGKTPPNSVRKDGTYFCTVCGYDSADKTYFKGYESEKCSKCGSRSKYFRHDGTMVCQSCKTAGPRFNRVPFETKPVVDSSEDILPFTSPEITLNGKILSLFVEKNVMKLSVDGGENEYPINMNNNVVFTIGKMGTINVDYHNPIEILKLYIRKIKHATLGKAAFEKEWKDVVKGTSFDFEPLTVIQLVERGLLPREKVEVDLIPLMNEKLSSVREWKSAETLCWAAEKFFEMGLYGRLEEETRAAQDLIKAYEQKAKEEARAEKLAQAKAAVRPVAAPAGSDGADVKSVKLPEGLETVSQTQVLLFGGYKLHYTLSNVEKV